MERLYHIHLSHFLENKEALSSQQYGFRKGHSTAEAVYDFLADLYHTRNNHQYVASVFIDIRKAFDCVNHDILLTQLEEAGINRTVLLWLRAYLKGRHQCTKVDGGTSSEKEVHFGVPQGSVLGPFLFIFFINSVLLSTGTAKAKLYADDVVLYTTSSYPAVALRNLQKEANILSKKCDKLRLAINHNKTKMMWFCGEHKRKHCSNRHLYIGDSRIQNTDT